MSEYVDHVIEVLAAFGPVSARRMFGGYGLYHDGLMFALVADDVLYLKADRQSLPFFAERDLPPFEYEKNGKRSKMSYHLAPESLFDDPQQAKEWAVRAYEAALRAKKK